MNILSKDSIKLLINNKNNYKLKVNKISKNKYFQKLKDRLIIIYGNEIIIENIKISKMDYKIVDDSYFVGKSIQNKMSGLKYSYKIEYENININFITNKNLNIVKKRINKVIKIIKTIKDFFGRNNAYQQLIIYDINEKKKLPKNNNETIIPDNCNSGYCSVLYNDKKNGDIVLYRNEEFYKVLIHELMHANFVDYQIIINQNKSNMNKKICTNYNILLNEAFTETFSCLLNMIIIHHETKINIDIIFKNEVNFMLKTYNKLLKYYNITKIEDIIVKNGCVKYFKQKTNVFSYYILKFLNYLYINDFLKLMEKYTNKNYIVNNGTFNKEYVKYVFKNIYSLNKFIKKDNIKDRGLRLTLYELRL
jgi:hypothetical protein